MAAYSETRSFRDALEGRSMEEAISGPVDRDTSSYGDRTGSGPSTPPASMGQMMLNIPANGNLNGPGQERLDRDREQQKADGGGELEREAGPISGAQTPMEQATKQLMEQRAVARQRMAGGRNGRLGAMRMAPARLQQESEEGSGSKGFEEQQSKPVEQQQQQSSGYGKPTNEAEANRSPMAAGYGAGASNGGQEAQQVGANGNGNGDGYAKQQSIGLDEQQPGQQQVMMMNGGGEQERSYGNGNGNGDISARERAMAAALMALGGVGNGGGANGADRMKYARNRPATGQAARQTSMAMMNGEAGSGAQQQYGDKRPSSMAQNMLMSLANKAAYSQRRQLVPPMMMTAPEAANGRSNGQQQQAVQMSATWGAMGGNSRAMRRAKQRRVEKKMSPAMVNAMLNKMVGSERNGQEAGGYPGGQSNGQAQGNEYSASADGQISAARRPNGALAILMKSPMGAEMLANMLMLNQNGAAAASGMAANEQREQYKRMMMAAIMQQQQEADYSSEQQQVGEGQRQQAENGPSYGDKARPSSGPSTVAPPMSMLMMNMRPAAMSKGADMGQPMIGNGAHGSERSRAPMTAGRVEQSAEVGADQQQQREMGPMTNAMMMTTTLAGGRIGAMMRPTMSYGMPTANKMVAAMGKPTAGGPSYGREMEQQQGDLTESAKTRTNGMNGASGNGNDAYGASAMAEASMGTKSAGAMQQTEERQQQQQVSEAGYGQQAAAGTKSSAPEANYGAKAQMVRPSPPMVQQKAAGYGDGQQQQQEDYGNGNGAAPIGMAEPFAFNYKIEDDYGNGQYRKEESDKNGVVRGSYGYMDTSGIYRHVEYVADENGFRANIKSNEPGLSDEPAPRGPSGGPAQGPSSSSSSLGAEAANQSQENQQEMVGMPQMQAQQQMQMEMQMQQAQGEQQMPSAGGNGMQRQYSSPSSQQMSEGGGK